MPNFIYLEDVNMKYDLVFKVMINTGVVGVVDYEYVPESNEEIEIFDKIDELANLDFNCAVNIMKDYYSCTIENAKDLREELDSAIDKINKGDVNMEENNLKKALGAIALNSAYNNAKQENLKKAAEGRPMFIAHSMSKTANTLVTETVIKELSKTEFLDKMIFGYGHSIQVDKNKSVGEITICSNTINAICNLPDDKFAIAARKFLEIIIGNYKTELLEYLGRGKESYTGLFVERIIIDGKEIDKIDVRNSHNHKGSEDELLAEILNSDLEDVNNLRKLFRDLNRLFRLYQELSIDAAKKLYKVSCIFYQDIMRAESTMGLRHYFDSFDNLKELTYYRDGYFITDKDKSFGELQEHYDDNGKLAAITFKDVFSEIQTSLADQVVKAIKESAAEAYENVYCREDLLLEASNMEELYADTYNTLRKKYAKVIQWRQHQFESAKALLDSREISKYAYYKLIDAAKANAKKLFAEISNDFRWITKDMSLEEAGFLAYAVSNIKRVGQNWTVDTDSTNQFFLTIAPEAYIAYVAKEKAEIKVCGYELLGDVDSVQIGDKLDMTCGVADNFDVFVDSDFTGTLTVQEVDGKICAVKPIEIPRVAAYTPETWTIGIYKNSVINAKEFAANKVRTFSKSFDGLEGLLKRALEIKLVPYYVYQDAQGIDHPVYNAIVCKFADKNDSSIIYEIPVASYLCKSKELEEVLLGLTTTEIKSFAIDGKTAYVELPYANAKFDSEVAPNHTKEENNNVPEMDMNIFGMQIQHKEKDNHENAFGPTSGVAKTTKEKSEAEEMLGSSADLGFTEEEDLASFCLDEMF